MVNFMLCIFTIIIKKNKLHFEYILKVAPKSEGFYVGMKAKEVWVWSIKINGKTPRAGNLGRKIRSLVIRL